MLWCRTRAWASIVHIWFVTLSCDHRPRIIVCFDHILATLQLFHVHGQQHGARHRWSAYQSVSWCLVEHLSRQMKSHQLTEMEEFLVCPLSKH